MVLLLVVVKNLSPFSLGFLFSQWVFFLFSSCGEGQTKGPCLPATQARGLILRWEHVGP
jgi:hypothetical protein